MILGEILENDILQSDQTRQVVDTAFIESKLEYNCIYRARKVVRRQISY